MGEKRQPSPPAQCGLGVSPASSPPWRFRSVPAPPPPVPSLCIIITTPVLIFSPGGSLLFQATCVTFRSPWDRPAVFPSWSSFTADVAPWDLCWKSGSPVARPLLPRCPPGVRLLRPPRESSLLSAGVGEGAGLQAECFFREAVCCKCDCTAIAVLLKLRNIFFLTLASVSFLSVCNVPAEDGFTGLELSVRGVVQRVICARVCRSE